MTDRELLEAAAKAAGIDAWWSEIHNTMFLSEKYDSGSEYQADAVWNPLTDDGDALRLAVKLQFKVVTPWTSGGYKRCRADHIPSGSQGPWVEDADPYAATRRAIVLAAAELS